ncbi:exodeoxyribonuclease VII large subunit [Pseudogemmobacter sp. W21_MBD1_M6]|uniref:exodeoxyribonuclease VII large subunit n=1 Tax=Pseudogemmobacter sp. W21_MBD1_M6 TaxID=3240271 RepID=UPI003F9BF3D9
MSDLIDDPSGGLNSPEYTVSEISGAVKRVIEGEFGLVRVRGEVGRVTRPRSGHVYLDLKDDSSVLAGIMWKGKAAQLRVQPEEGMEVVATGKLTTFPGQSKYQIIIDDIQPAGMGALMMMLEKRKAMLEAEGLFDQSRKKPLPYLPEIIGVITSPTGAVIRDILHRLRDRFPRKVLIWPVAVQGDRCAAEVAAAIRGFNAFTPGGALPRPDLIIVARGGGSIEDLWGFNEEIVARAAAASDIPLISAVGHETDTTLIDFVSDRRAPTPTAAAELAVPVRLDLLAWVGEQDSRLVRAARRGVDLRGQRLRDLARALPRAEALLSGPAQKLDLWGERLRPALGAATQKKKLVLSEKGGALRPALLRRVVQDKRALFDRRADRLRLPLLQRDLEIRKKDLAAVLSRLSQAGITQVKRQRDKLDALERLRQTLGYTETLKRGYAVVRGDGDVVTSKKAAGAASDLEIQFHDGRIAVGAAVKPIKKPKAGAPEAGQGSLF